MGLPDFETTKKDDEVIVEKQEVKVEDKPAKPEYDENELLAIFDEIIFSGEYTEKVSIRGKLNITLRTRTAEEVSKITSKIDLTPSNLISTANERRALMNLHFALVEYQGKDISKAKAEDREKFINSLPAPVIGTLLISLDRFDRKVYKACEVGEENF
jgi:hypothetical protein